MGYWSIHPMCGDKPEECKSSVTYIAMSYLIGEIQTTMILEECSIPETLLNWIKECKTTNYDEILENYWEIEITEKRPFPYADLYNYYKYDIISNFLDEEDAFVVPFMFIENNIKVKPEYVQYLIDMLGNGDASYRGYEEWTGERNHPMYYVNIVEKYSDSFFNEENHDLEDEVFIEAHKTELMEIEPKNLFETMFDTLEGNNSSLVNTR